MEQPKGSSLVWDLSCFIKKEPTLGMNPLAAPSVTSSFQHQVLLLMKHEVSNIRNEPFGCSQEVLAVIQKIQFLLLLLAFLAMKWGPSR